MNKYVRVLFPRRIFRKSLAQLDTIRLDAHSFPGYRASYVLSRLEGRRARCRAHELSITVVLGKIRLAVRSLETPEDGLHHPLGALPPASRLQRLELLRRDGRNAPPWKTPPRLEVKLDGPGRG